MACATSEIFGNGWPKVCPLPKWWRLRDRLTPGAVWHHYNLEYIPGSRRWLERWMKNTSKPLRTSRMWSGWETLCATSRLSCSGECSHIFTTMCYFCTTRAGESVTQVAAWQSCYPPCSRWAYGNSYSLTEQQEGPAILLALLRHLDNHQIGDAVDYNTQNIGTNQDKE